jgi:hypothetical protein
LSPQLFVCAYDLDKHQTVQNTYGIKKRICEHKCICVFLRLSLLLGVHCSLESIRFPSCEQTCTKAYIHTSQEI